jgi:hypothetical protein
VGLGLAGAALAPGVAFYLALYPALRRRARGVAARLLAVLARRRGLSPATRAYMESRKVWDDGWAGPHVILPVPDAIAAGGPVRLKGMVDLSLVQGSQTLVVKSGAAEARTVMVERSGPFNLDLPAIAAEGIEIIASDFYVPHNFRRNNDHRPLSWRFDGIEAL